MILYSQGDQTADDLLAQWWMRMRDEGELETTLLPSAHALGGFYKIFQAGADLVFEVDDHGIWIAAWAERFMAGAMFGLWIRKDKRGKPSTLKKLLEIYDLTFQQGVCAIMGVTRQPTLLPAHRKLGYNIGGKIPGLWDGHDAWFVVLTREDFYGRWQWKGRRESEQKSGGEQPRVVPRVHAAEA